MASIYKRNGKLYINYTQNGTRVQKSLGLPDTKAGRMLAKREKNKIEIALSEGKPLTFIAKPIGEGVNEYLTEALVAESTKKMYRHALEKLVRKVGAKTRISSIKDVTGILRSCDLSDGSLATYSVVAHGFWEWAIKKRYAVKNPVDVIKAKEPKPIRIIPEKVIELIISQCSSQDECDFLRFLELSGFRVSEATALKWTNIEWENNRIVFVNQKKGRVDEFPLGAKLSALLKNIPRKGELVFPTVSIARVRQRIKNLGYTLHDYRRTFASRLLKKGASPYAVMRLMRHRNFQTTARYYAHIELQSMCDVLDLA